MIHPIAFAVITARGDGRADGPDLVAPGAPMPNAQPFSTPVDPAWVDYNGHVNDASYATIAALANERLLADLDLSAGHRKATGRALYSAQLRITYLAEIRPDAHIRVLRTVTRLGTTSLTIDTAFHTGPNDSSAPVATSEHVYVLVDTEAGVTTPFDPDERGRVEPLVGTWV